MSFVTTLDTDIDVKELLDTILINLPDNPTDWGEGRLIEELVMQWSLTSINGDDDWTCSVGRAAELEYPERYYSTINKSLMGTPVADLINKYPSFYRWRLLLLPPKHTYSIHKDGVDGKSNIRIHIPLQTNPRAFLTFYDKPPWDNKRVNVECYHLETGNSYLCNVTNFHTAVNYGSEDRYHITGVKYENSTDRPH